MLRPYWLLQRRQTLCRHLTILCVADAPQKGPQCWELWMSKVECNVFCLLIGLEDFMLSVLSLVEIRQALRASTKPNILNLKASRIWEIKTDNTDFVREGHIVVYSEVQGADHGAVHHNIMISLIRGDIGALDQDWLRHDAHQQVQPLLELLEKKWACLACFQ